MLDNALCEQLVALNDRAGGNCYLLMQNGHQETEADTRFNDLAEQIQICSMPVRHPALPPGFSPYLLRIRMNEGMPATLSSLAVSMALADKATSALRRGVVQRTCAWIWTSATAEQLSDNIAERLISPCASAYAGRRWLRYYDPMVTDLFLQACTPANRAHYFDCITHWAFIDRWKRLSVHTPDAEAPVGCRNVNWSCIRCIGAVNQAWIRARLDAIDVLPEAFDLALDAVATAHRQGMTEQADLDLFAWQSFYLGPRFHAHDVVRALLSAVAAGKRYDEMVYQIDESTWQRVALEAGLHGPRSTGWGER
ncbi:hypothetical protein [Stenotrophomonas sp.]|uniref:hypothetical protein n=1 Tax=Stenotrophomonas sp. TaxID=69392 RepID=UPI0028AFC9EB|nr:hypothetical protein [Stenotrophomonas sp.]